MQQEWRWSFPILREGYYYFDNAATTHKPQEVITAVQELYSSSNAPLYRGFYKSSEQMTRAYEGVRQQIAHAVRAADARSIVLTRGATEALNIVARSWLQAQLRRGDTVVITALEHHANSLPWYEIARAVGASVQVIPVDPVTLQLDRAAIDRLITERTRLVSFPLSSNIRGPLASDEIAALLHRARSVGAAICYDAAQVPAHGPLDMGQGNPDFCIWSGHKLFAPTGVGVLYIARRRWDEMVPSEWGGGMVVDSSEGQCTWQPMPRLLEAGTRPVEAVIGLGAAYDFLAHQAPYKAIQQHERQLMNHLLDGLKGISGIRLLGDEELLRTSGHLVTFAIAGIHGHDLALYLAQRGIAVRAGTHCCQYLHDMLGIASSIRISCALYNTLDEVQYLREALVAGAKLLNP